MKAPNEKEVECCATCQNGKNDYDMITCSKYGTMIPYEICDDFISELDK